MPPIKELIKQRIKRLDTVPNSFANRVARSQHDIYQKILLKLDKIDVGMDGAVTQTPNNLALIKEISAELKKIVIDPLSPYSKSVKGFIEEFSEQKILNRSFYEESFEDFQNEKMYDQTYKTAVSNANKLVSQSAVNTLTTEFEDLLQTAIGSGDNYANIVKNIGDLIKGNSQIDGSLARYAKQNAKDIFAVADRQYSKAISDNLEVQFFQYSGGLIDTSRPFCEERNGKIFHKKEIEAWGKGEKTLGMKWPKGGKWAGMASNTSAQTIFSLAGGYQCDHVMVPVALKYVPIDVIRRAIQQGFLKKSDLPEAIRAKL
jgi:hypothetical protein